MITEKHLVESGLYYHEKAANASKELQKELAADMELMKEVLKVKYVKRKE